MRIRGSARSRAVALSALTLLVVMGGLWGQEEQLDLKAFRPQWKVGQKWVVETVTRRNQARHAPQLDQMAKSVRWQFKVEAVEECEGESSFRLQITSLLPGPQNQTTLWVERKSMTLRRIRMEMPTAQGVIPVEETYRSSSGQPFPAMSAIMVPPVELPVFMSGTKGTSSFAYEALSGPSQEKALGDVGFGCAVEQTVVVPEASDYPSLLPAEHAKSLENRPTIEVRLKAAGNQVRQVWQSGLPWPVFSDNGFTRALLVPNADRPSESSSN